VVEGSELKLLGLLRSDSNADHSLTTTPTHSYPSMITLPPAARAPPAPRSAAPRALLRRPRPAHAALAAVAADADAMPPKRAAAAVPTDTAAAAPAVAKKAKKAPADKAAAAPAAKAAKKAGAAPAGKAAAAPAAAKKAKGALAVGDNVSAVTATLTLNDGAETTLAALTADSGAVIFMYPRANTGGCTKQALGFKAHAAELEAAGFQIFGLSYDSPKSQTNWQAKYDLPYALLTDTKDGAALKAFGASKPDKKISRSHVVVAKGGALLDARNAISPGDSFAEAVKFVAALKK
jgi:peroxiredoxin Q/BCP